MADLNLGIGSQVQHPKFGTGVVVQADHSFYEIYFNEINSAKSIGREYEGMEVIEKSQAESLPFTMEDLQKAVDKAFVKYVDSPQMVPLAGKFIGGRLEIHPGDQDLQPKEIPIESFFHKIVMVRDKLRILEQSINTHPKLDDEDKVNLQQYITRIYGSLTTFNVLFNHKQYYFKGSGGK